MSFLFDATGERMTGTLTTGVTPPLTVVMWTKVSDYNNTGDNCFFMLGATAGNAVDAISMRMKSTLDNSWRYTNRDATNTPDVFYTIQLDNQWFAILAETASSTSRQCWVQALANASGIDTTTVNLTTLDELVVGENLPGAQDVGSAGFPVRIAEFAVWAGTLTDAEKTQILAGVRPSLIRPDILRVYYPFSTAGATQNNEGLDTGGDLTVQNATFSSDHPTMSELTTIAFRPVRKIFVLP